MPATPKMTPEEWGNARARWEDDPRDGFQWLVDELALPVTAPGVRKKAKTEGWGKVSGASVGTAKPTQAGGNQAKPKGKSKPANGLGEPGKVSKVSSAQRNQGSDREAKVSARETIETISKTETMPDDSCNPKKRQLEAYKYKPEYADQAHKLCLLGLTDVQMAEVFGIAESTFYLWKQRFPEFAEAIASGKVHADANVAKSLYQRAIGYEHEEVHLNVVGGELIQTTLIKRYPPDTTAAKHWLHNRSPNAWRREHELEVNVNMNVFPPREVLDSVYQKALADAAVREAEVLEGRFVRITGMTEGEALDGEG